MPPRVLISDSLSPAAAQIFRLRGLDVDFEPTLGKDKDKLAAVIGDYDGLAIRSATKVTADIFARAPRLKVVGRAGIGVDNVDVAAATARGVIVMNTPFGNSITTAEHAIALMFALAREIPAADASTQAGKWEKNRFMGVEITGKTLGVVGCGNVGANVAERALGLKMRVIAFDPYLTQERAEGAWRRKDRPRRAFGARRLHHAAHAADARRRRISSRRKTSPRRARACASSIARAAGSSTKTALRKALDDGHVAGAAFDVFAQEPATENPLFGASARRLHAASRRFDERGAGKGRAADRRTDGGLSDPRRDRQRGEFPLDQRRRGAAAEALRRTRRKARSLRGSGRRRRRRAHCRSSTKGAVALQKTRPITAAAISGLLRPILEDVNPVSAPILAKERGLAIEEITREAQGDYESLVTLSAHTAQGEICVSGTVFHDGKPRIVGIGDIGVDAEFAPSMIYLTNEDRPGFIGRFAGVLGEAEVNIATFALGRDRPGGGAVALVAIDGELPPQALAALKSLPGVKQATTLKF